jgi:hypothetical protein
MGHERQREGVHHLKGTQPADNHRRDGQDEQVDESSGRHGRKDGCTALDHDSPDTTLVEVGQ